MRFWKFFVPFRTYLPSLYNYERFCYISLSPFQAESLILLHTTIPLQFIFIMNPHFICIMKLRFISTLAMLSLIFSGLHTLSSCSAGAHQGASPAATARRVLSERLPGTAIEITVDSSLNIPAEGFENAFRNDSLIIRASSEAGALYGAFDAIRRAQSLTTAQLPAEWSDAPKLPLRILNHWDNLDGTVERGYAGKSIWKWDSPLTAADRQLYEKYAEINASTGINGTVLNNVNASPQILSTERLKRVAEIADILRPYAMKVYLSVNFASPMALDSLPTADPLDPAVKAWWRKKADEIYDLIPDFGGFLVKANSEGQPGPMDFGHSHADGANMLADALAPHNGTVMWRAFVYSPSDADRAKQAYLEFQPFDGQFRDNVIIQIKNGPIDFQPREPYSPLFDAMHSTPEMAELQITQEYLGHSNHLAFLAPMWKEFFSMVPYQRLKGAAGVANIGDAPNFTAHPFAAANWYAFGRLAWNPELTAREIANEWISAQLLSSKDVPQEVTENLVEMMISSREAVVDYMMPLGLHHIFAFGHHYGPEPWCDVPGAREDWLPRYYHRADKNGIGFDRTSKGSGATEQYAEPWRVIFDNVDACPDEYLLWFHHVPWNHKMKNGNTLWEELCAHYQRGVERVGSYREVWESARDYVDPEVFADVATRLDTQYKDAEWWRDACLSYFGSIAGLALPEGYPQPKHSLEYYKQISLPVSNYECPSPALLDSVR